MPPRIIAEAFKVEGCPLYPVGGGMMFREPAVGGIDPHPACALAVERFVPTFQKITKGKHPEKFSGVTCGGCNDGEAWFRFRIEGDGEMPTLSGMSSETRAALANSRVFHGIGPGQLTRAVPFFEEKRVLAGATLIEKGGVVDGLFVIVSGKFDIVQVDEEGNQTVVAHVGAGDCIGEISMITGDRASATVRAQSDASLVMVPRGQMPNLMAVIPVLPARLAHILAGRLVQTSQKFQSEAGRGLKGRLEAISPAELVQTLTVSNLSGMLRVTHKGQEMMMFFHEGKLGEVNLGDKSGEEAFYSFMEWARGDFSFEPGEHARDTSSARRDPTGWLLEGLRRKDETLRITKDQLPKVSG